MSFKLEGSFHSIKMNDNWQAELHRKWPSPPLPRLPLLPLKVDFQCRVIFTCVRAYVGKIYVRK